MTIYTFHDTKNIKSTEKVSKFVLVSYHAAESPETLFQSDCIWLFPEAQPTEAKCKVSRLTVRTLGSQLLNTLSEELNQP